MSDLEWPNDKNMTKHEATFWLQSLKPLHSMCPPDYSPSIGTVPRPSRQPEAKRRYVWYFCGIVLYHILSIIIRCLFKFRLLNFAIVGGLAVWPMKIKIQPVEIETKRPNIVAFDGVPWLVHDHRIIHENCSQHFRTVWNMATWNSAGMCWNSGKLHVQMIDIGLLGLLAVSPMTHHLI